MSTAQEFMEQASRIKRETVIRDGKRIRRKRKVYAVECKPGWRRDPNTGKCVKMSSQERRKRSLSAKKAARKSSTKRKRAKSLRRRANTVN